MTADPLAHAWELLSRGHGLYRDDRVDAGMRGVTATGPLGVPPGLGPAATRRGERLAVGLQRTATTDAELSRLLAVAARDHRFGRNRTGAILDDARADRLPAIDTPIGRREAMRRMESRLRAQRHCIKASRRRARLLSRRVARLDYPGRRHGGFGAPDRHGEALPLTAVRYRRSASTGPVRRHVAAALDRLGIDDARARANWLRGYQTLIARESGGRAGVVGSEPATAAGPVQPDGHALGYPRGLTQTIPATFARYHQPGTSTNIYDPVANICASMNYVMHRYGVTADGTNLTALVQQADRHRPPKGY